MKPPTYVWLISLQLMHEQLEYGYFHISVVIWLLHCIGVTRAQIYVVGY